MARDFVTYLVRSLLSEGRLRYEFVEKTSESLRVRLIEREGRTGLIVNTTATRRHPENEIRLLSLTVTDTREQTRDILASLAKDETAAADLAPWHALQEWLASPAAECDVTILYTPALAELVPPVAIRLRRDFGAVLNLIQIHAILHQADREMLAEACKRAIRTEEINTALPPQTVEGPKGGKGSLPPPETVHACPPRKIRANLRIAGQRTAR